MSRHDAVSGATLALRLLDSWARSWGVPFGVWQFGPWGVGAWLGFCGTPHSGPPLYSSEEAQKSVKMAMTMSTTKMIMTHDVGDVDGDEDDDADDERRR